MSVTSILVSRGSHVAFLADYNQINRSAFRTTAEDLKPLVAMRLSEVCFLQSSSGNQM